jgi:hypothetical protein
MQMLQSTLLPNMQMLQPRSVYYAVLQPYYLPDMQLLQPYLSLICR